jgi:hypothetical protein
MGTASILIVAGQTRLVNGWPQKCIDELMPWFWTPPQQPP